MNPTRRQFLEAIAAWVAVSRVPHLRAATPSALARSPITNRWGTAKTTRLQVEHATIFTGMPGRAFNHQPQLTSDNGKLVATWSMGIRDEDSPGQKMVAATSGDGGVTWTEPMTIAPSTPGRLGESAVLSSGLRVHGNTWIAYYGEWERTREGMNPDGTRTTSWTGVLTNVRCQARTSVDAGRVWSKPILVMPNQISYMPPAPTHSGRLIYPGNLTYPVTDDPEGLTGWRRIGLPGIGADYVDDFYNMHQGAQRLGFNELFSEASFFQTDDGVIHMMLRNEKGPFRGVTESRDNGETWTRPMLTDFTDAVCRAHFGRLPDGRFFSMGCPKPPAAGKRNGERTPAILATSRDGIAFDRHYVVGDQPQGAPRMPGLAKAGRYGYPYVHVFADQVRVIYSRNKEDICVACFPLSALI